MDPTAQPDLTPTARYPLDRVELSVGGHRVTGFAETPMPVDAIPQRPTGIYPTADGGREVVIGEEHVGATREAIVAALQDSAPDLSVTLEGDGIRIGWAKPRGPKLPSTRKMKGGKARRPGKRAPRLPTRSRP